MRLVQRALLVGALVGGAVLGLAGCGGSSSAKEGGVLRATYASFPDYLDPQLSYTLEGWTAMYDTYIPLLTLAHTRGEAGSRVVPGLATSLPRISDGGRTYTLTLRKGLRYSDGTPVRASDFSATMERLFLINSPGSPFFTDIVGAEHFARTKRGGIAGISADDASGRIVIHLARPRGTFTYELTMLFAAPLPAGTPAVDQTAAPPPATGPYAIADTKVGRGWSYVRNPQWEKHNADLVTEVPSGHLDAIDVEVVRNDSTRIHEVENGEADWTQSGPPADLYASVRRKYEGTQFRVERTVSTYYFWMNTRRPPFNDVRVRQAVNYAVDPAALERIYAGSLTASHQVLPVGMPGHRSLNLYPHNLAKARRMIREANPADRTITVWANDESPNNEATAYYQSVLNQIGFDARLREINADNYFAVIGNKSTPDRDTGWHNWFADYPHPNDFFEPMLDGESILPVGNSNFSQMDWPLLNEEIAKLGEEVLGPEQEEKYAELDRNYMELAPWVPYGTNTTSTFVNGGVDLDGVVYNPTYGHDLTSFSFE